MPGQARTDGSTSHVVLSVGLDVGHRRNVLYEKGTESTEHVCRGRSSERIGSTIMEAGKTQERVDAAVLA